MIRKSVFALVAAVGCAASVSSAGFATAVPDYPCGSAHGWNVAAYKATCEFGFNLAQAFNAGEDLAYSPVTGMNYPFSCRNSTLQSGYAISYECNIWSQQGGLVHLWRE